jgi:integrase/recombinase XerD
VAFTPLIEGPTASDQREEHWLGQCHPTQLELPKEEQVLNTTDITTPLGLRDRALLETLYSTAIRRREYANLQVYDVDTARRIVTVQKSYRQTASIPPTALLWARTGRHASRQVALTG